MHKLKKNSELRYFVCKLYYTPAHEFLSCRSQGCWLVGWLISQSAGCMCQKICGTSCFLRLHWNLVHIKCVYSRDIFLWLSAQSQSYWIHICKSSILSPSLTALGFSLLWKQMCATANANNYSMFLFCPNPFCYFSYVLYKFVSLFFCCCFCFYYFHYKHKTLH